MFGERISLVTHMAIQTVFELSLVVDEILEIEQSIDIWSCNSLFSIMRNLVDNFKQLFVVRNRTFLSNGIHGIIVQVYCCCQIAATHWHTNFETE